MPGFPVSQRNLTYNYIFFSHPYIFRKSFVTKLFSDANNYSTRPLRIMNFVRLSFIIHNSEWSCRIIKIQPKPLVHKGVTASFRREIFLIVYNYFSSSAGFSASGFARICLNLRVRRWKPGGGAKKKRPVIFS